MPFQKKPASVLYGMLFSRLSDSLQLLELVSELGEANACLSARDATGKHYFDVRESILRIAIKKSKNVL